MHQRFGSYEESSLMTRKGPNKEEELVDQGTVQLGVREDFIEPDAGNEHVDGAVDVTESPDALIKAAY